MVRVPTRGRNVLDLVFTTDDEMVKDVEVGLGLAGSDHGTVTFKVTVGNDPEKIGFGRKLNLRRANYASFLRPCRTLYSIRMPSQSKKCGKI